MRRHRLSVVRRIASTAGAGAALLSSETSLRWVGVAGARHALVSAGEAVLLAPRSASAPAGVAVERFDAHRRASVAEALARALVRVGIGPADPVAVEPAALPIELRDVLGRDVCRDVGDALAGARARKDADELALIARAAELATIGQQALREQLVEGVSELELWGAARAAMQAASERPVDVVVDLTSGARIALAGVSPGSRAVARGEPVLFDLAPRHDGYWAGSCATLSCGAPPESLRRRHDAVRRALERGLDAVRPGVTAGDVDRAMRTALDDAGLDCPHHTGHAVGTAPEERPWLLPGERTVLEDGMVLELKPGSYTSPTGVRLGQLVVVAAGGVRPLTAHSIDL